MARHTQDERWHRHGPAATERRRHSLLKPFSLIRAIDDGRDAGGPPFTTAHQTGAGAVPCSDGSGPCFAAAVIPGRAAEPVSAAELYPLFKPLRKPVLLNYAPRA